MEDKIQFKRTIRKWGDSLAYVLPPELVEYANLQEGQEVILQPAKGKYGKYITTHQNKKEEK